MDRQVAERTRGDFEIDITHNLHASAMGLADADERGCRFPGLHVDDFGYDFKGVEKLNLIRVGRQKNIREASQRGFGNVRLPDGDVGKTPMNLKFVATAWQPRRLLDEIIS